MWARELRKGNTYRPVGAKVDYRTVQDISDAVDANREDVVLIHTTEGERCWLYAEEVIELKGGHYEVG